jgi:hypothetical protein
VGVQLKGLKVQIGLHLAVQIGQSGFQCAQAHGAPRASNVRNKIDFHGEHQQLSWQTKPRILPQITDNRSGRHPSP